jgi:peptide/nickel transport system ATP-binding protein
MSALLSVRGLTTSVRLGKRELPAVDDVSFEVGAGRTLGLVGESGCGKSLTAMSILRLLPEPAVRITGGQVLFGGVDLAKAPEASLRKIRGARIAMIFQEPSVATLAEQVGEPLRIHQGLTRRQAAARAVGLLEQVGIPAAAERARAYPHQLSGGMKQRAMIAMALACRPELLIADEPTTALDVTVQAQILELLRRLRQELGMALLLITHDLGVVAETCDDVAVMYAGRVVEQSDVATLFRAPRHPYTVGLLRAVPKAESTSPDAAAARAHAVGAPAVIASYVPATADAPVDAVLPRARLQEIAGMVPPLSALPPGCSFAPRCPNVLDDCRATVPPLETAEEDRGGDGRHVVRCFHPVAGDRSKP